MRRLLLLGLLAIFGIGAVSVLVIKLAGASPGFFSLDSTPPAEAPVAPPPSFGLAPAPPEATAQSWVPPPAPKQELLPPPPRGSWYETAIVSRPAAMGRLGAAISQGLADLQPRVSACFDG